jgi:hypothetical protein
MAWVFTGNFLDNFASDRTVVRSPLRALPRPKTRTPGSAAVVEGHLVAVGVREREGAAERPVDGR